MTEIPTDVMKAALEATAKVSLFGATNPGWADVIARAILAERERCAGILMALHEGQSGETFDTTFLDVAERIREGRE